MKVYGDYSGVPVSAGLSLHRLLVHMDARWESVQRRKRLGLRTNNGFWRARDVYCGRYCKTTVVR